LVPAVGASVGAGAAGAVVGFAAAGAVVGAAAGAVVGFAAGGALVGAGVAAGPHAAASSNVHADRTYSERLMCFVSPGVALIREGSKTSLFWPPWQLSTNVCYTTGRRVVNSSAASATITAPTNAGSRSM